MLSLLHASRLPTFGTSHSGGRNYDYTKIYSAEKPGEEANGNARVWNVYLDEAENHDADMIQGFLNIIDSLLVFAALFSAVVTTFIAQTSQVLQPDNAQIMVFLLFETNQLLRAAGNGTTISAVPASPLGPQSQTHTSIDVWVNGLFFTSLALSLSTALLSVLAKQWIQAYIAIVPGDARIRTLIRHFRFQGLIKWKLDVIIESIPLILHCSVAIFLVGLALYVLQLSHPICGIVAGITAFTFLFYFGSSMIPAFNIACPYRIPFMFFLAQFLPSIPSICWKLWYMLPWKFILVPLKLLNLFTWKLPQSLKLREHNKVLDDFFSGAMHLTLDSLGWVFNQSSNHSVKEVIIEGTCGYLNELLNRNTLPSISSSQDELFVSAITYSLSRLPHICSTSSMDDRIEESTIYGRLIVTFIKASYSQSLLSNEHGNLPKAWKSRMIDALTDAYEEALKKKHHNLSRCILDWGGSSLLQCATGQENKFLTNCARYGHAEDLHDLVNRGINLNHCRFNGWTALHDAAFNFNMDVVIALIQQEPALLAAQGEWSRNLSCTVLDLAIWNGNYSRNFDMVAYLLDHGAKPSSHSSLHYMMSFFSSSPPVNAVEFLLDHGWDRTVKDDKGETLLDIACSKGNQALIEHLKHYQTVRLPPYGTIPHAADEEVKKYTDKFTEGI